MCSIYTNSAHLVYEGSEGPLRLRLFKTSHRRAQQRYVSWLVCQKEEVDLGLLDIPIVSVPFRFVPWLMRLIVIAYLCISCTILE